MVRSPRQLLVVGARGALLGARAALVTGLLAAGCGSSPPVDQNFGTNLGADFVAPVTDAGAEVGGGGAGGAGGSTEPGTGGMTGTGGTGGSAMDSGAGGTGGQ